MKKSLFVASAVIIGGLLCGMFTMTHQFGDPGKVVMDEYILGNIKDKPKREDLESSTAWGKLEEFREYVKDNCKSCKFIKYCEGGCPYNAIVASKTPKAVDPQCESYKKIFEEVSARANKEFLKSAIPGMSAKKEENDPFSIMDLMMKP